MQKKRMKSFAIPLLLFAASLQVASSHPALAAQPAQIYKLTGSIKIGGEGGWDYLTLSPDGHTLYITRTTHTMVVDVATGQATADIRGTIVAHGAALGKVAAADDADAIIYDPASKQVLAFCGDAHQMVAIAPDVDLKSGKASATLDLGGKPEFAVADGRGK